MSTVAPKGLQDVVANESSICYIDGAKGILSYRGIDIHELAQQSTFEETTYLLWNGKLPTAEELKDFTAQLAAARELPTRSSTSSAAVPTRLRPWRCCAPPYRCSPSTMRTRNRAARSKPAQELPAHRADRHDRGHLRPHP